MKICLNKLDGTYSIDIRLVALRIHYGDAPRDGYHCCALPCYRDERGRVHHLHCHVCNHCDARSCHRGGHVNDRFAHYHVCECDYDVRSLPLPHGDLLHEFVPHFCACD